MNKKDAIILAQIGILATLIFSFQVIFEFIQSLIGLTGNSWLFLFGVLNPIIATIIISSIYVFWLSKPMPKIIVTYSIILYVAIRFVSSNIFNAFDIQRIYGTIFISWFYLALGLSMVIFIAMYFILTAIIHLTSKIILKNSTENIRKVSIKIPEYKEIKKQENIPKIEIYKDELPKIPVSKNIVKKIKKENKKKQKINKKSAKKR